MENIALTSHNDYRSLHRETPALHWDAQLARDSHTWAEKLAQSGKLSHGTTGENVYYQWSSKDIDQQEAVERAVESWYSEIKNYDLPNSQSKGSGTTGHFTQVVWCGSQKLGVGVSKTSKNNGTAVYVVARYLPPGNYVGEHKENVKPLK